MANKQLETLVSLLLPAQMVGAALGFQLAVKPAMGLQTQVAWTYLIHNLTVKSQYLVKMSTYISCFPLSSTLCPLSSNSS